MGPTPRTAGAAEADAGQGEGGGVADIGLREAFLLPAEEEVVLPAAVVEAPALDAEADGFAVGVLDVFALPAAGELELVGQGRVQGDGILGGGLLPDHGDFASEQRGMSPAVHPGSFPVEAQARAHVGGGADADADLVARGGNEVHVDGDLAVLAGLFGARADADLLEIVACEELAVQRGDLFGGVGVAG
jgi:hypothetical protein